MFIYLFLLAELFPGFTVGLLDDFIAGINKNAVFFLSVRESLLLLYFTVAILFVLFNGKVTPLRLKLHFNLIDLTSY